METTITGKRKLKPHTKITYKKSTIVEFCNYCGSLMVDAIYPDENTILVCNNEQCSSSFTQRLKKR